MNTPTQTLLTLADKWREQARTGQCSLAGHSFADDLQSVLTRCLHAADGKTIGQVLFEESTHGHLTWDALPDKAAYEEAALLTVLAANARKVPTVEGRNLMPNAVKREWVKCPICGDCDMRKESDEEGCAIILCTNHVCKSNGGDNTDALTSPPPEPKMPVEQAQDGGFMKWWSTKVTGLMTGLESAQAAWLESARQSQAKVANLEAKCKDWDYIYSQTALKLEAANEELAQLRWRDVSIRPTREDADTNGLVQATNGHSTWHEAITSSWPTSITLWRPAAIPASPDAFTIWHAKHGGTRAAYDEARQS